MFLGLGSGRRVWISASGLRRMVEDEVEIENAVEVFGWLWDPLRGVGVWVGVGRGWGWQMGVVGD